MNHRVVNDEMLRMKSIEFNQNLNTDILRQAMDGFKNLKRHSIQFLKISEEIYHQMIQQYPHLLGVLKVNSNHQD